ncbi:hypothetical protein [Liquorilactobacillus mali]|uniref:Uncharacterized protein n=1 Tax=Liquorilactobacillus mali TaxID=1618 RepID=A0A0R2FPF2_9LACO|nr:hypothetical protein [Liquorilactobacillus mali]KRN26461.1 hypothetical protein IV36_GL002011 [Liquorilactobacillus mali]MDV7758214.1 hypothetical protein [Liquorilactobacillus mali]
MSDPKNESNVASQVWMALTKVLPIEQNRKLMDAALENLFPVKGIATSYMYHHIAETLFETQQLS